MAKKEENKKDKQKIESKEGKAPKTSPAKREASTDPGISGKVKGPKGTGRGKTGAKRTGTKSEGKDASEGISGKSSSEVEGGTGMRQNKRGTSLTAENSSGGKFSENKESDEPSGEVKKLPKPKKALPEKGTPDNDSGKSSAESKTTKPAKFSKPVVDDPIPDVAAPAEGVVKPEPSNKKDLADHKTPKKAAEDSDKTARVSNKADSEKKERPAAKKMSRGRTVPGISAEEKMKLPNTSPSDDLKETFKATKEGVKEKLTPDEQTRQDLEKKAKDYIPDPDEVKEAAGNLTDKLIKGAKKAKELADEVLPDKETVAAAAEMAKNKIKEATQETTEEQQSSKDKPVEATLLSEFDIHLFREGKHYHLYNKLGSHLMDYMGTKGVYFAVWAPNADSVAVMGDFNNWNKESHQMKSRWDNSGIWEVFIPEAKKGTLYKYFLRSSNGYEAEKGDPYAFSWETPPDTASVVWDLENTWKDKVWMNKRKKQQGKAQPYSVYELHLGSWKRVPEDNNRSLTYRELAEDLPNYLNEMGFTHVEFMPIMEHPFFGSWGYQITGYFAPSSRFGTPQDFMHLIDRLHQAGIGVILDWVPSHFPSDLHGIHYFDGTHLYEHEDPQKGFHPDWQSYIFNYGRNEVRSFLISNALFWLDKFHVDGLRVDAVASMLYLDYSRKEGEWQPNEEGGRENLEAISFLKEFNEVVYREFPDTVTIAEESTAWPMVSKPTYMGGLGFGMKWMMGWMHDTLAYFSQDPIHRRHHQNTITFSTNYAFSENFMLPLSHDEVVYGKGSILTKMPGDTWNKFANLRTLYSYMFAHPGTKLLFMGAEFGQNIEWNHDSSLEWHLTEQDPHRQIQETLKELNRLYTSEPALYEKAFSHEGFEWIDFKDEENSIISFVRKGEDRKDDILVVLNFTPVPRENYRIGAPAEGRWKEIFNSDDQRFGGSNVKNEEAVETEKLPAHRQDSSLSLRIPPLGAVYLKKQ